MILKYLFSILCVIGFTLGAGEIKFSEFHPVSEAMTVETRFLKCRFFKYHAFPAGIELAGKKKIPWFGLTDGIQKSDGSSFRTEHDAWSILQADPAQKCVTARAVFCRRRWKPHPEVFPGAAAFYRYSFSAEKPEIIFQCRVEGICQKPDVKLTLLALCWPRDAVRKYSLSEDKKKLRILFEDTGAVLDGSFSSVRIAGDYLQIEPEIQYGNDAASASLKIRFYAY